MDASQKLLAIAREYGDGVDRIDNPNWDSEQRCWEAYVSDRVRTIWPELSLESRLLAYIHAVDTQNRKKGE